MRAALATVHRPVELREDVGWNARAGIFNTNFEVRLHDAVAPGRGCHSHDAGLAGDRFDGILQQVEQQLLEPVGVGMQVRRIGDESRLNVDSAGDEVRRPAERDEVFDDAIGIDRADRRQAVFGCLQGIFEDLRYTCDFSTDDTKLARTDRVLGKLDFKCRQVILDDRQRIADLVHELTQAFVQLGGLVASPVMHWRIRHIRHIRRIQHIHRRLGTAKKPPGHLRKMFEAEHALADSNRLCFAGKSGDQNAMALALAT